MATNQNKIIDDKYKETLKAQKAQAQATRDIAAMGYNKQLKDVPAKYNKLRNETAVNKNMQDRLRKENMANMGLSGAGGTSKTFAQRNTNNYLKSIGNIGRQQQDFTDNINLALTNLDTQYGADMNSMTAQNNAARNAEYMQQNQWQSGHDLQKQQFEQQKKDALYGQAYGLFKSGMITKAQFKAMTGITLR